jgi:hypothetical protein
MRTIITLLLLLPVFQLQLLAQGKIQLKEFDSKACAVKSESVLKGKISRCKNLDSAEHLLKNVCGFTKGNKYILICEGCGPKLNDRIRMCPGSQQFGDLNKDNMHGLNSKGDNKIYNLKQLRTMLVDSLAIFDSLQLDIYNMPPADKTRAKSLYFKEAGSQVKYFPYYNNVSDVLIIRKEIFNAKSQDQFHLNAFYMDGEIEKAIPGKLDLFFLDVAEKEELAIIAADLKRFDETVFTSSDGMEYLENAICGKYKQVDKESLLLWLATHGL